VYRYVTHLLRLSTCFSEIAVSKTDKDTGMVENIFVLFSEASAYSHFARILLHVP